MKTNELSFEQLNAVAGGMTKQPTTPLFPPSTGPTVPVPPKDPIVARV